MPRCRPSYMDFVLDSANDICTRPQFADAIRWCCYSLERAGGRTRHDILLMRGAEEIMQVRFLKSRTSTGTWSEVGVRPCVLRQQILLRYNTLLQINDRLRTDVLTPSASSFPLSDSWFHLYSILIAQVAITFRAAILTKQRPSPLVSRQQVRAPRSLFVSALSLSRIAWKRSIAHM